MVRPLYYQQVLPKGIYELRNEDGTELKTSFNSLRLKIYHHPVQSHPTTNTYAEMPLKSGANEEEKNTSTELTKSVKVDLLEKDRNTILSNGCLDENVINKSEKRRREAISEHWWLARYTAVPNILFCCF